MFGFGLGLVLRVGVGLKGLDPGPNLIHLCHTPGLFQYVNVTLRAQFNMLISHPVSNVLIILHPGSNLIR